MRTVLTTGVDSGSVIKAVPSLGLIIEFVER